MSGCENLKELNVSNCAALERLNVSDGGFGTPAMMALAAFLPLTFKDRKRNG